jgi:ribosome-associated toxin RatA of RatAB toxin-antitoxin module
MKLKRAASATLSGSPGLVYEVVSDYASYAQWLPGISSSQVLAQETNFAITELEFRALPGKKVTVECIHAPTSMVVARSLSGNSPAFKLEWNIAPAATGQSLVTLKMERAIASAMFVGSLRNLLEPRTALAALGGALSGYGEGPTGEKVFEIIKNDDGLVCWYQGTKYEMKAIS